MGKAFPHLGMGQPASRKPAQHGPSSRPLNPPARPSLAGRLPQVAGLQRSARYGARVAPEAVRSLRACVHSIYASEGVAGFYKGALPSVAKAAPAAAVTFMAYGVAMRLLTQWSAPELADQLQKPSRPLH